MTKETSYQIEIYDPLSTEEREILKASGTLHGFYNISFPPFMNRIEMCSTNDEEDIIKAVANWLNRIGAVEDIFSITQIATFYTNKEFEMMS